MTQKIKMKPAKIFPFGDCLVPDRTAMKDIKLAFIKGKELGRADTLKEEVEWLEILYKRFPHEFVLQRLNKMKENSK